MDLSFTRSVKPVAVGVTLSDHQGSVEASSVSKKGPRAADQRSSSQRSSISKERSDSERSSVNRLTEYVDQSRSDSAAGATRICRSPCLSNESSRGRAMQPAQPAAISCESGRLSGIQPQRMRLP